jgi:hypothetical protein
MTLPLADINEGQFQAAWYYSVVAAGVFALVLYGGVWAVRGAVRMWRFGEREAAVVFSAAAITAVLIFVGFLIAAAFGLHIMFRHA